MYIFKLWRGGVGVLVCESSIGFLFQEDDKKALRRERNKQAAARCRKRRMDLTSQLQVGRLAETPNFWTTKFQIDILNNFGHMTTFFMAGSLCFASMYEFTKLNRYALLIYVYRFDRILNYLTVDQCMTRTRWRTGRGGCGPSRKSCYS